MPGFLAQLLYDRSHGLAVAVTSNSGSRNAPDAVAEGMLDDARKALPAAIEPWTPGDDAMVSAIRRWRAKRRDMERQFYASRVPVR